LHTARDYFDALAAQETETRLLIDDEAGHAWLPSSPEAIVEWFSAQAPRVERDEPDIESQP